MKAATYPDADHRAAASPTKKMTPADPCDRCRLRMASVKMSWAGPGASVDTLSISGWVADWPTRPSRETSTSSAGKIDRMA